MQKLSAIVLFLCINLFTFFPLLQTQAAEIKDDEASIKEARNQAIYYLYYLKHEPTKENLNKAEQQLDIINSYFKTFCPDANTTDRCLYFFNQLRIILYMRPDTAKTDYKKAITILELEAKRTSLWAHAELAYFYKCTEPDEKKYKLWQNKLIERLKKSTYHKPANAPLNCDSTEIHPDILRY